MLSDPFLYKNGKDMNLSDAVDGSPLGITDENETCFFLFEGFDEDGKIIYPASYAILEDGKSIEELQVCGESGNARKCFMRWRSCAVKAEERGSAYSLNGPAADYIKNRLSGGQYI